jgi:PA14 domain./Domain of Unknown Function (DUF1080).
VIARRHLASLPTLSLVTALAPFLSIAQTEPPSEAFPAFEEPAVLDLTSLRDFDAPPPNWILAGHVSGGPLQEPTLQPQPGAGVLVNVASENTPNPHLATSWHHGDLDLQFEFLLPRHTRAGVLLQGRYEVRLFDSWGRGQADAESCGAISPDFAPAFEVCRASGLWQRMRIVFHAPRFDRRGAKIANARIALVELNGVSVQTNLELAGPTFGSLFSDEAAIGPLVWRGSGGPVALRSIATLCRQGSRPVEILRGAYRFFPGRFRSFDTYENTPPADAGTSPSLRADIVRSPGPFALIWEGEVSLPADGVYSFYLATEKHAFSSARLRIDDRAPEPAKTQPHATSLHLTAGVHRYRIDYLRGSIRGSPDLVWLVAGPETPPQVLAGSTRDLRNRPNQPILIETKSAVALQRCFFAHPSGQKTRAVAVGSPTGIHFAYDLETAALLAVWKGDFLDASEMWHERGFSQEGRPAGSLLPLAARPLFSAPSPSTGYTLSAKGTPVFHGEFVGQRWEDTIVPVHPARGLSRTLSFAGGLRDTVALTLARATRIEASGNRFVLGDREYYLEFPHETGAVAKLERHDREVTLRVRLPAGTESFRYTLFW